MMKIQQVYYVHSPHMLEEVVMLCQRGIGKYGFVIIYKGCNYDVLQYISASFYIYDIRGVQL